MRGQRDRPGGPRTVQLFSEREGVIELGQSSRRRLLEDRRDQQPGGSLFAANDTEDRILAIIGEYLRPLINQIIHPEPPIHVRVCRKAERSKSWLPGLQEWSTRVDHGDFR